MNKRLAKILINSLHAIVIFLSLYFTLGAAVYDAKGGDTLEVYGILFGAVLCPIIVMDVIIWYTIKKNNRASIYFSDIVQIVVSSVVTIIISLLSVGSYEDIKFVVVWSIILLKSIIMVILQKYQSKNGFSIYKR